MSNCNNGEKDNGSGRSFDEKLRNDSTSTPSAGVPPLEDLEAFADDREWLVEDFLPNGVIGLVPGKPMAGKSWATQELGVAIASGTAFMGKFDVLREGSVLLIDQDMSTEAAAQRLRDLSRGEATAKIRLASQQDHHLDTDKGGRWLRETVQDLDPRLVVIDCVSMCVSEHFEENNADDVRRFFQNLRAAQEVNQCTVLVVHHFRKNTSSGTTLDWVRGSSALTAGIDVAYSVHPFSVDGKFVVQPVPKRVRIPAPGFLAEVRDEESGGGIEVKWVRDCFTNDPEMEEQVQFVMGVAKERGSEGVTVNDVKKMAEGYLDQREARKVLKYGEERDLLVRKAEEHNRYRWWTPEYFPYGPSRGGQDGYV